MANRWKSKFMYRYENEFGVIREKADQYFIGGLTVDTSWAEKIRSAEAARGKKGRPTLYPLQVCKTYGITLPIRFWNKIEKPYSKAIAGMIEGKK